MSRIFRNISLMCYRDYSISARARNAPIRLIFKKGKMYEFRCEEWRSGKLIELNGTEFRRYYGIGEDQIERHLPRTLICNWFYNIIEMRDRKIENILKENE